MARPFDVEKLQFAGDPKKRLVELRYGRVVKMPITLEEARELRRRLDEAIETANDSYIPF